MNQTRIEELARARGFTQDRLVLELEGRVTASTVKRLWQDREMRENPRIGTLRAIASALGVRVDDLGYSEERQPSNNRMSLAGVAA